MERKIKVSAVSYLNTKPLLYGIERHPLRAHIELDIEYPALIAKHLQDGASDIGLVPVAAIPLIPGARIIADYGIAADGAVASVCIFSKVPLEQVKRIYLDYQSRTSVRLARLLLEKYWKLNIELIQAPENYIELIDGGTAGVIIGDRALQHLSDFEYIYDLSACWKAYTGMPFIFAAWVAYRELPEEFIRQFNEANEYGLQHLDEVIAENPYPYYNLHTYYTQNIQYFFDEEKHKGLQRFLSEIS